MENKKYVGVITIRTSVKQQNGINRIFGCTIGIAGYGWTADKEKETRIRLKEMIEETMRRNTAHYGYTSSSKYSITAKFRITECDFFMGEKKTENKQ